MNGYLWRIIRILTFVSVNGQNNDARASGIQTYTEPVPLKYRKLATKYPWIYGYFFYSEIANSRDRNPVDYAPRLK